MIQGLLVIAAGFLFNIIETWIFGWNMQAQSVAESFCDDVSFLVILIGLVMFSAAWNKTLE